MERSKNLKILILGGTKFIGKGLFLFLKKKNFKVKTFSRKKLYSKKNTKNHYLDDIKNFSKYICNEEFDIIVDFISKDRKLTEKILSTVKFKKYFFISTTWMSRINKSIKVNTPITKKFFISKKLPEVTRKYLRDKMNVEHLIYNIFKKNFNKKIFILRLPIMIGTNDSTKRINYYVKMLRNKNFPYKFYNQKINLLRIENFYEAFEKLIYNLKINILSSKKIIECLNPKYITFGKIIYLISKKMKKKIINTKTDINSKKTFGPYKHDIYLKISNSNIFKITKTKTYKANKLFNNLKIN